MMALWTSPALVTKEALVPGAINVADSEDYSIAISPNTGHVYWMSTRNGDAELLWQPTSTSAPPPPARAGSEGQGRHDRMPARG
ncbi:MAG: hypothetical protein WDO69_06265 [Pseudomonadota bacterium]